MPPFPRLLLLLTLLTSTLSFKTQAQQGILFQPNPYPDHYFFTPSGLRTEAGKRYFQNTSVIFFHSNTSRENGKSLGWGLIPTFVTGQTNDIPIWITAAKRWRTRNPNVNAWAGGFFLKLPKEAENDGWIFHSGITFGTAEKNLSVGLFTGSFEKHTPPFKGIMLNGQVRLGRKSWLVCENHLALRSTSVMPVCLWGFRTKTKPMMLECGMGWAKVARTTPEFGGEQSQYVPLPWFSLVFNGRKRNLAQ